jgi:hypothetical protein
MNEVQSAEAPQFILLKSKCRHLLFSLKPSRAVTAIARRTSGTTANLDECIGLWSTIEIWMITQGNERSVPRS